MESLSDVEFGAKSVEEAPILIAQRYLNIFRQVHVFNKATRDKFDDELLALPENVINFIKKMPGGRLLIEHIEEVKTDRGISFVKTNRDEFTNSSDSSANTSGAVVPMQGGGGNVVMDASFAETLARSMASAFKNIPNRVSTDQISSSSVDIGQAFELIAEEIRSSHSSLLDVLKETRNITDSVIASQVSISRILEGILSSRMTKDNNNDLNNQIIASQASITKLLENLYNSNLQKESKSDISIDIERRLSQFEREIKDEIKSMLISNTSEFQNPDVSEIKPRVDFSTHDRKNTPNFSKNNELKKKKINRPTIGSTASFASVSLATNNADAFDTSLNGINEVNIPEDNFISIGGVIHNSAYKHEDDFSNINLNKPPLEQTKTSVVEDSSVQHPETVNKQPQETITNFDIHPIDNNFNSQSIDDNLNDVPESSNNGLDLDNFADLDLDNFDKHSDYNTDISHKANSPDTVASDASSDDILNNDDFSSLKKLDNLDNIQASSANDLDLDHLAENDEIAPIDESNDVASLSLNDYETTNSLNDTLSLEDNSFDSFVANTSQNDALNSDVLASLDSLDNLDDIKTSSAEALDLDDLTINDATSVISENAEDLDLANFTSQNDLHTSSSPENNSDDSLSHNFSSLDNLDDIQSNTTQETLSSENDINSEDPLSNTDITSIDDINLDSFSTDDSDASFSNQTESSEEIAVDTIEKTEEEDPSVLHSESPRPSRFNDTLDKIRDALTSDHIDIASLDEPIALDDYSDDENVSEDDIPVKSIKSEEPTSDDEWEYEYVEDDVSANEDSNSEDEWEYEYVDENGNVVTSQSQNQADGDWEWEFVDENQDNTSDDENKQQ